MYNNMWNLIFGDDKAKNQNENNLSKISKMTEIDDVEEILKDYVVIIDNDCLRKTEHFKDWCTRIRADTEPSPSSPSFPIKDAEIVKDKEETKTGSIIIKPIKLKTENNKENISKNSSLFNINPVRSSPRNDEEIKNLIKDSLLPTDKIDRPVSEPLKMTQIEEDRLYEESVKRGAVRKYSTKPQRKPQEHLHKQQTPIKNFENLNLSNGNELNNKHEDIRKTVEKQLKRDLEKINKIKEQQKEAQKLEEETQKEQKQKEQKENEEEKEEKEEPKEKQKKDEDEDSDIEVLYNSKKPMSLSEEFAISVQDHYKVGLGPKGAALWFLGVNDKLSTGIYFGFQQYINSLRIHIFPLSFTNTSIYVRRHMFKAFYEYIEGKDDISPLITTGKIMAKFGALSITPFELVSEKERIQARNEHNNQDTKTCFYEILFKRTPTSNIKDIVVSVHENQQIQKVDLVIRTHEQGTPRKYVRKIIKFLERRKVLKRPDFVTSPAKNSATDTDSDTHYI